MKRFRFYFCFSVILSLLFFSECGDRNHAAYSTINGSLSPSGSEPFFLISVDTSAFNKIDSVVPDNKGKFTFRFKPEHPGIFHLSKKTRLVAPLVIFPGDNINISIRQDSVWVTGGKEAGLFFTFRQMITNCEAYADSLGTELILARDMDNYTEIKAETDAAYAKMMQMAKQEAVDFVVKHPSALSQLLVMNSKIQQVYLFDETIDSSWFFYTDSALMSHFADNPHVIANHRRIKSLRISLKTERDARKSMQIGQISPELNLPGLHGKPVSLRSLKHKYTLVYFWSPIDAPSRKANLELKNIYEQYKNHDVEVYAVSFDQYAERWKAAINLDKLWWTNVNDTLMLNSPVAQAWNIQKLPLFVLLDKQGRILERFTNTKTLRQWLEEKKLP